ncbi:PAS domain S-box protein, partial [Pseudanabaenaceae cyanobacterium LEGE 13415]|nr:PAS domain S-box protein [Pseudanabaenaceae cyanobacterium LEGE 13415]
MLDFNDLTCVEASQAALPDSAEFGMVLQLADGTIAACNATARKLLRLDTEQGQGWASINSLWQAIRADGTDFPGETHPAMVALSSGKQQRQVVMGLYQPSGTLIWLEVDAQPLFQTADSMPYAVVSTFKQIPAPLPPELVSVLSSPAAPVPASSPPVIALYEAMALFNLSIDLLGTARLDGCFQTLNPAFQRILGYAIGELAAQPLLNFVHPDDQAATIAELEKLNQGATTLSFTNRCRTKSGEYKWLEWTAVPVVDRGIMYLTARDVTEHRIQETALREAEERWQLTIRGSNDGVWDWNARTNEVLFSSRWKAMLGYEDHEIENRFEEWSNLVHPEDLPGAMQAIQDHFDRKTAFYESEHRLRCKDGSYKWILSRGKALWDEAGNAVRMVGMHTDVTDRKTLEAALQSANDTLEQRVAERTAELEQAYQDLAESEITAQRRLAEIEAIYATAPIGLCFVDRELRFVRMNEHLAQINGFPVEAHLGRTLREILPEQADELESLYRQVLETRIPLENLEIHGTNAAQPGVERDWRLSLYPLQDSAGQVLGINVMVQEVSDLKRTEATLRESQAQLQQQLAEIEAIYQSAPIGLNVLDTDLRFVRINQRLAEINGHSVEDHIGRTVREVLPDLADAAEQLLRPILETGEPLLNVEIHGETPAQPGVERIWLEHFLPLKRGNRVVGISTVCEEITDRRKSELALREAHIQLESALVAGSVYTWRWNIPDNRVTTDRYFARMFGVDPDAAAAGLAIEHFLDAMHPDDRPRVTAAIEQAIATGEEYTAEYRVRDVERQERWVIARGRAEYDANGRAIAFPGALVDITARKQTEAALRASEEHSRTILESINDGFVALDENWRFTHVNQAAEQLLSRTSEDLIGKNIWEEYPMDGTEFERIYRETMRDRTVGTATAFYPNHDRWYEARSYPASLGITIYFKDITEQVRSEEALRQSEAFKNRLLESSPDCIKLLDLDGRLLYMNAGGLCAMEVEDFTRYCNVEWASFWGESRLEAERALETAKAGEMCMFRGYCPTAKVTPKWWEVIVTPISDAAGQVEQILAISRDITERRQAEADLQQLAASLHGSTDRLTTAIEAAQFGTWEVDLTVQPYVAYPRSLRHDQIYGYGSLHPNWDYDTFISHIHPDDRALIAEKFQQTVTTGEDWTVECRIIRADQSQGWIWLRGSVSEDETGQRKRLIGLISDISERKATEAALQQSEDRYRMAIASAKLGTWDWNLITNELKWDAECKAMFGLPPEAGSSIELFFAGLHPEDRDRLSDIVQTALDPQSGGMYDTEYRTIGIEDGIERWIAAKGQAYFSSTGQPTRFIGTVLDITEAKQREAERQRAQAQLRDRQERLEAALFASETGTFRWNIHTNELDWDENLDRLFGLPPGQTARSLEAFIQMVHPDDRQGVVDCCARCASEGTDFDMDFRVVYPDGSIHWLSDKGKAVLDEHGNPAYMSGACVDITDRKQAELRLELAQQVSNAGFFDWQIKEGTAFVTGLLRQIAPVNPETGQVSFADWEAIVHPEDTVRVQSIIESVFAAHQKRFAYDFRVRTPDGDVWLAAQAEVEYNSIGQPERIIGINYDITDRKQAEAELLQKTAIISAVSESTPTLIYVKDRAGKMLMANAAVIEAVGCPESEVLGHTSLEFHQPREAAEQVMENDRAVMESGQTQVIEESLASPTGWRVFQSVKSPYRNNAGEVIGLIGVSTDITDRVQLERDREQVLQQAQVAREASDRANRIKDEFLSVLSHELRTPLNP